MPIRVGVFGAGGRMGSTVCGAVIAAPALELVAAVDPHHAGLDVRSVTGAEVPQLQVAGTADALADAGAEVAVDFTVAMAARENLRWCGEHGVHAVVGTTGLGDGDITELRSVFTGAAGGANCIVAP